MYFRIANERKAMRTNQESEAEAKYRTTSKPPVVSRQQTSAIPLPRRGCRSQNQLRQVKRHPDNPGLLWRLRRDGGNCAPASPDLLEGMLPVSCRSRGSDFHFPGEFASVGTSSSLSPESALELKFKLDGEGDVEDSYLLGDEVEVIPNPSGYAGCDEIVR